MSLIVKLNLKDYSIIHNKLNAFNINCVVNTFSFFLVNYANFFMFLIKWDAQNVKSLISWVKRISRKEEFYLTHSIEYKKMNELDSFESWNHLYGISPLGMTDFLSTKIVIKSNKCYLTFHFIIFVIGISCLLSQD